MSAFLQVLEGRHGQSVTSPTWMDTNAGVPQIPVLGDPRTVMQLMQTSYDDIFSSLGAAG